MYHDAFIFPKFRSNLKGRFVKGFRASLRRYFLTGLLVITPIWGTVLVLKTLFVTVDGILGNVVAKVLTPESYVPGLGILTLLLLIFATGLLATNFIGGQVVKLWEELLHRVPVVRGIYSTLKSMMDILSFTEREKYNRVVLIQFPKDGNYCFAFVTGMTRGEVQTISPVPLLNVYVPMSPNPTSGYFLLVPENEVVPLDLSVDEAMKLIVSGGLYSPTQPVQTAGGAATTKAATKRRARRSSAAGYVAHSGATINAPNFVQPARPTAAPRAQSDVTSQKPTSRNAGMIASFVFAFSV